MCDAGVVIRKLQSQPTHSAVTVTGKEKHLGMPNANPKVGPPPPALPRRALWWPHFEQGAADPGEIHQHDAGVDPRYSVERVAGEAAVPADLGHFVLRRHGRQLGAVEGLEEAPDVVHRPQEEHIGVDVEQRVHVLQDDLREDTGQPVSKQM